MTWVLLVAAVLAAVVLLGPTLLELLRWTVRRIGWLVLVLAAGAALVGLALLLLLPVLVVVAGVWLWGRLPQFVRDFWHVRWAWTAGFWVAAWRRVRGAAGELRDWAVRLSLLVRPSRRSDPVSPDEQGDDEPDEGPVPMGERPWTELAAAAGKVIAAGAGGTGAVVLVGATILWVRFGTVGVSAGQAVNAAGRQEWLVTGWYALILFVVAAGLAVLLTRALDRDATSRRPTRRGLMIVLVLELLAAVALERFRTWETVQLVAGFALATVLLHVLIDRAIPVGRGLRDPELHGVPGVAKGWLVGQEQPEGPTSGHPRLLMAWRVLALVPLAAAVAAASTAERADRPLFIVPALVLAALMMTARWGIAEEARSGSADDIEPIETARVLLALTTLACLAILLGRDELWLLGAAATAMVLAIACLVVASVTGGRFAPYAVAVMVAVPLYGAVLVSLRAIDRPELQPVAVVTDGGRAVCGVYVGRTDGRIWYAELDLREKVPSNRTVRLRGRLTSVPDGDGTVTRVAPLQSLADAQVRAVQMRDELLAERGKGPGGPTCTTEPADPVPETRAQAGLRRLADATAPELLVAKDDRFPPVSAQTIFALHDRRRQICRRIDRKHCLRIAHQGELPWSGGEGQYLDYPAKPTSKSGQRDALIRTLGTADPERRAATYYLVTGRPDGPVSVQHWFYYPFNYQRVELRPGHVKGGFHEGDFESVGVLLSKTRRRPRFVWMARHDSEGRVFGFNETALETDGGHVRVHAARGSHASYEHCGRQVRPVGNGRVDDHAPCEDVDLLHFSSGATPRIDLSRVGWACWHGRFGQGAETVFEGLPQIVNMGPLSPLWQQGYGGVKRAPCRGVPDPGGRQGPAEQVDDPRTAARLRRGAGQLTPLVDQCSDWERRALDGVFISACNQGVLDAYVESGFERPGPEGVRIARPDDPAPRSKVPDVPPVQRDHDALRPAQWRITTQRTTTMTVFVSCRQGGRRVLDARFEEVRLRPGRRYRVDDRGPEVWRLRTGDGEIVAAATPVAGGRPAGATVDCSAQPPRGG